MSNAAQFFAADGPLSKRIADYQPRAAQVEMAQAVEQAVADRATLVVEAGTGTGKTFSYLVPVLQSGQKAIVSTGTKALQEQLFHRDLPNVLAAMKDPFDVALLKGRANYLCTQRLEQHLWQRGELAKDPLLAADMVKVQRWANSTKEGDLGELADIAEDSRALPFVTSTTENCLGRDCPHYQGCYLNKARQRAREADLVVVNHHLFMADMVLKDTGFGELIPEARALVFDEAHQLPEIASSYFGEALSSRQLVELAKDVRRGYLTQARDSKQLGKAADLLEKCARDLRLAFYPDPARGSWRDALRNPKFVQGITQLADALQFTYDVLKLVLGVSKELDLCLERAAAHKNLLERFAAGEQVGVSLWWETSKHHLILNLTPLDVAKRFSAYMETQDAAWIFTSATLRIGDSFRHFTDQLGLGEPASLALSSPFDYPNQAIFYLPRYLPEPNQTNAETLLKAALPLIEAAGGRTFFLFTSYRMMHEVGALLPERITQPVLVQGNGSKRVLLRQFQQAGNAVLLATASFWEGVDVRGDALCCVIIDKLPFAAPDDPLLQARIEDCRKRGQDPFMQLQLPQSVLAMKQGAGRLIRDVSDRGVLMVCDNRLLTRKYGGLFLSSLPAMRRSRNPQQVVDFLASIARSDD